MRNLTLQEAQDILHGACIYGTGGGGSLTEGLNIIKEIYEEGKQINLIKLELVEDDWLIVSPYYVGSVTPPSEEITKKLEKIVPTAENVSTIAARKLEKRLNKRIQAVIATELGGNTAWAMKTAVDLGVPLIDADPAGRAMPDIAHTTFNIFDISIAPFALANRYGDSLIVETVANHDHAEKIARTFATISGNFAGICDHPIYGETLKKSVVPQTLSQSEHLGRSMRLANEQGISPIPAIVNAGSGKLLFKGTVKDAEWKDANGFIEGSIYIESLENQLTIWFRNEHMIAKLDDNIVSIIPELIAVVDGKTGMPILNPSCVKGMDVAVLTFPAPEVWESEKGLSIFGPSYIGMDQESYREITKSLS